MLDGLKMEKKIMNKNYGFTLAEVLITLAIIGIVAALTIPTLISNYQKREYVTRLQRGIAILNNGIQLMMADEGVFEPSQLAYYKCYGDNGNATINIDGEKRECINNYFSKYFKIIDYSNKQNDTDFYPAYNEILQINGTTSTSQGAFNIVSWYGFVTSDGIMFIPDSFTTDALIDVNGTKGPNQIGRDIFMLDQKNGLYSAHGMDTWDDESETNDYCGDNNPTLGLGCAGRIVAEGWQMNY